MRGWNQRPALLWVSGIWILPLWWLALHLLPASFPDTFAVSALALAASPVPALLASRRDRAALTQQLAASADDAERLKLELESVRYRTARLREELTAAEQQSRLSHQLTILGQFTAGFLHEFNNPLAIVTSRIEVLLEERKDDPDLCADLQYMLKEANYMGNIAGTLLRALRRERSEQTFEPSPPGEILPEILAALSPAAEKNGVRLLLEAADVPRVNLPEHVVNEVVRGLVTNAFQALAGREGATVCLRLEPYRTVGSNVVLRVEDNGPGVPEDFRPHLFEPFASQNTGRERLGLGLFLCASLLDIYDGRLTYEPRNGGGACFVVQMPPARFTRGQPYHWFVKVPE